MISCIVINGIIFLIIFFKRSALCNGWMYMYDVVYIYIVWLTTPSTLCNWSGGCGLCTLQYKSTLVSAALSLSFSHH